MRCELPASHVAAASLVASSLCGGSGPLLQEQVGLRALGKTPVPCNALAKRDGTMNPEAH